MKFLHGSAYLLATTIVVAGCSAQPDDRASPGPETVTVTYSSSTSNAPTTQTVTSSPSSTRSPRSSTSKGSSSGTSSSSGSSSTSSANETDGGGEDEDGQLPGTAAEYADAFVRAWGRGDRPSASTYGTSAAVSALFGGGSGGAGWTRTSTTGYAGSTEVTYSNGTRTLTVIVDHTPLGTRSEHAVTSAAFSEDTPSTPPSGDGLPTSVTSYTDAFVRAWGKGSGSAWTYTSAEVGSGLGENRPSGGPGWSRASSTATTATYTTRDGGTLVLTVNLDLVRIGAQDAIVGAVLS